MHKRSYYVINGITIYRVAAAALLLFFIIIHKPDVFKWLLAVSFFTDAIDGYLARKYKVTSTFGSKIDSLGDDLTILMALIGVAVMKTSFLREQSVLIVVMLVLYLLQNVMAFIRYRKITSFHTYLAKAAAVLQGSFLILIFFLPKPPLFLFYAAAVVTILDLIEETILVALLPKWETNVKGIYWVLRKPLKDRAGEN
jgi:CDP-diacylglycerol--glycerol-3-phosphate 3-phosphatidyltransferase